MIKERTSFAVNFTDNDLECYLELLTSGDEAPRDPRKYIIKIKLSKVKLALHTSVIHYDYWVIGVSRCKQ